MSDKLARIDQGGSVASIPDTPPLAEMLELQADIESAWAESTLRAYRQAWGAFEDWCRSEGLVALPAPREALYRYLKHLEARRVGVRQMEKVLAAVKHRHALAGAPSYTGDAWLRLAFAGIRKRVGRPPRQVTPFMPAHLRAAAEHLDPGKLIDVRDLALAAYGIGTAGRRSEIVATELEHITFIEERGMDVFVPRSKTDQQGVGLHKSVAFGSRPLTCPVRALQRWLEAAGIEGGPVFRPVTRWGHVGAAGLSAQVVSRVVKRLARLAGAEDPNGFGGHSLRAGFATAAAEAYKPPERIMAQMGHASIGTTMGYVRHATRWEDNPTEGIGL